MPPVEKFILERLASIEARPAMWGTTRHEIGLQIILLVETWHVAHGTQFELARTMRDVLEDGPACIDPPDVEWVRRAVAAARSLTTGATP